MPPKQQLAGRPCLQIGAHVAGWLAHAFTKLYRLHFYGINATTVALGYVHVLEPLHTWIIMESWGGTHG